MKWTLMSITVHAHSFNPLYVHIVTQFSNIAYISSKKGHKTCFKTKGSLSNEKQKQTKTMHACIKGAVPQPIFKISPQEKDKLPKMHLTEVTLSLSALHLLPFGL